VDAPLLYFKIRGEHSDDLREMFDKTESQAAEVLKDRLNCVPQLKLDIQPPDD
jgi:hypothetical protein